MLDVLIRANLLHDYHSTPCAGHISESRTMNQLSSLYYWRNMRTTIEQFIKSSRSCQQTKAHNHKPHGLLRSIDPWNVNGR